MKIETIKRILSETVMTFFLIVFAGVVAYFFTVDWSPIKKFTKWFVEVIGNEKVAVFASVVVFAILPLNLFWKLLCCIFKMK